MRNARECSPGLVRNTAIWLTVLFALTVPVNAQLETAVNEAETWLLGAQNLNGSFGTLDALTPRDSAVAVVALHGRASSEPAVARGLIYLTGVPEANTHFRSQRALALARAGRPFQPLLDSLLDFRNGDGMGAFGAHESNLLDSALAVEALAEDEGARLLVIAPLLDYLLLHQQTDGGWGFVPEDGSEVYYTAETACSTPASSCWPPRW